MAKLINRKTLQITIVVLVAAILCSFIGLYFVVSASEPTIKPYPKFAKYDSYADSGLPGSFVLAGTGSNCAFAEAYNKECVITYTLTDKNGFQYLYDVEFSYAYLITGSSTDAEALAACDRYTDKFLEIFESNQVPYEDFITSKEPLFSLISQCGQYLKDNPVDGILFHFAVSGYGSNEGPFPEIDIREFIALLPDNFFAVLFPGTDLTYVDGFFDIPVSEEPMPVPLNTDIDAATVKLAKPEIDIHRDAASLQKFIYKDYFIVATLGEEIDVTVFDLKNKHFITSFTLPANDGFTTDNVLALTPDRDYRLSKTLDPQGADSVNFSISKKDGTISPFSGVINLYN